MGKTLPPHPCFHIPKATAGRGRAAASWEDPHGLTHCRTTLLGLQDPGKAEQTCPSSWEPACPPRTQASSSHSKLERKGKSRGERQHKSGTLLPASLKTRKHAAQPRCGGLTPELEQISNVDFQRRQPPRDENRPSFTI